MALSLSLSSLSDRLGCKCVCLEDALLGKICTYVNTHTHYMIFPVKLIFTALQDPSVTFRTER